MSDNRFMPHRREEEEAERKVIAASEPMVLVPASLVKGASDALTQMASTMQIFADDNKGLATVSRGYAGMAARCREMARALRGLSHD